MSPPPGTAAGSAVRWLAPGIRCSKDVWFDGCLALGGQMYQLLDIARVDMTRQVMAADSVDRLASWLTIAHHGLAHAYSPERRSFAQTMRRGNEGTRGLIMSEGINLRYSAIAALGLARLPEDLQRQTLGGETARQFAESVASRAERHPDPGVAALAAWAVAELLGGVPEALMRRLEAVVADDSLHLPTVELSWILTAAVAAGQRVGDSASRTVAESAATRLLATRGVGGTFARWPRAPRSQRWRAHIGSFADQIYPIQALARFHSFSGDPHSLQVANDTAMRVVARQGSAGQWWWHYDSRDGSVAEAYPVYSVHQHAMAPMGLFDLHQAGGDDHVTSIVEGLRWLEVHPEVTEGLVDEPNDAIWRKVGRREPKKAARVIAALSTALKPGLQMPGVDRLLPPVVVDHECRPYELGWMMYAWLSKPGQDG